MPNISPFWNDHRDPKPTPSIHCVVQVSASAPNIKITIASARCTLCRLRKEAAMHLGGMAGAMESCWERDENMLPSGKSPNSHDFCVGNCRGSYAVLLSYSCPNFIARFTEAAPSHPELRWLSKQIQYVNTHKTLGFSRICLRQNPLPNGKLLPILNWQIDVSRFRGKFRISESLGHGTRNKGN